MTIEFVNPLGVRKAAGFTQAVKVTPPATLVFISGQPGVDEKDHVVAVGDLEKQTRQAMENIGKILESMGASFKDLVALTIFTTRIHELAAIRKTRNEFLDRENPPTLCSVGVTGFAREEYLIEIKAVAAIR